MEGGDQYPTPEDHEPASCQQPSNKKKSANSKRFSDEQVKLLESMFTLETKLEAHKKLQLARDLGLQPRQVGIWFQNKRARWKSKQIEQDYRELKAKFDSLNVQFHYLKKENESLLMQVYTNILLLSYILHYFLLVISSHQKSNYIIPKQLERLRYEQENTPAGHGKGQDSKGSKMFSESDNKDSDFEIKENPAGCLNGGDENKMTENANNETLGINEYLEQKEEAEFLNLGELGDSLLSSQEKWCCMGLGDDAFYHSCETSKWWDI